jgi:hypothetical protein
MSNKPFLYPCVVIDNQDPLMLGRVRARITTDNYEDIISSITNPVWNEKTDKWSARDPFVFLPLLPYFVYQVPKKDELINAFFYNKDYKFQNQFYVQVTFSTPTTAHFEYYVGAQKNTGLGGQYKEPLPLKNQDGTYPDGSKYAGIFPEPGDNAILGRGTADIVVKEHEVLIRAAKTIGDIIPNTKPATNNRRAYLQLTKFPNIKILDDVITYNQENQKTVLVKYLVEWTIINPENSVDKLSGAIYLYKLKPNKRTNSQELKVNSDIEDLKSLVFSYDFNSLSKREIIDLINNFIRAVNDEGFFNGKALVYESPFPFYYRPNNKTYEKLTSTPTQGVGPLTNSSTEISNLSQIFNGVKLNGSVPTKGYSLVYAKDLTGQPFDVKEIVTPIFKYNNTPTTFGSMGADKLAFISHASSIPGKSKINFDGTIYGISNDVYTDEILPNTSSMVRGEELLELLNLIVRFLTTHTHAFPGLPPVPVTQDGTRVTSMLTEMQNAVNKVLNQNIRIN